MDRMIAVFWRARQLADSEKMKKMEAAFEKGFKQATKAWGRDLPDISNKTYDAVKDMFSNYYESKNVITDDQE